MSEHISEGFEREVASYARSLTNFIAAHDLPQEWFRSPDHLAYKCYDAVHYNDTVERWLEHAEEATYVELDGRRLASFRLKTPISIGQLGSVEWLEIMEPRPEKVGYDVVGVEHVEFMYPDFKRAEKHLRDEKVPYQLQDNPNHSWVNIVINSVGQELKLNNKPLSRIVEEEKNAGNAEIVEAPVPKKSATTSETLQSEVVFRGKLFEVVQTTQPSGEVYERAVRAPGVRLIIANKDNDKLLLTKEFRRELKAWDYRLPGGKVFDTLQEYDEFKAIAGDMEQAAVHKAKAEGREEAGVDINDVALYKKSTLGATVEWDLFVFEATSWNSNEEGQQLEVGEQIETDHWFSYDEVRQMILSSQMQEERVALILLQWLEAQNG